MDQNNTPRKRTSQQGRHTRRTQIDGRPTPRRRASSTQHNAAQSSTTQHHNSSKSTHQRGQQTQTPSWYDASQAQGSQQPRATLDTSYDNPRWYSQGSADVYIGSRKRKRRSKLPFIAAGLGVLVVLVVGIAIAVTSLTQTPEQTEETLAVSDTEQTSTSITLTFAGDCTLGTDENFDPSTSFDAVYESVNDPSYFMENVYDIFSNDDYTIVNMEGTLTESTTREDKTFAFKGPAEYTEVLTSGDIEAASLANNHSHDYGEQSYTDTIEALDDAGIVNFGYDRIGYADVKGVKVAFIGTYMLAEGLAIQDEMVANIEEARSEGAQVVIVFTHWGIEKETVPDTTQIELGHIAIDAGADLVVGSHPHVIQGYEKYNGRYIVYSLGNFCFGGNSSPSDMDCMIFQQTFTVTGDEVATDDEINVIPCSISSTSSHNNYQPTPAEGSEADRILEKIETSNESIAELSETVS